MHLISLPRMFISETEGWDEVARIHPSVAKLTAYYVLPLSLIPPLMNAFVHLAYPGEVLPRVEPPFTIVELALVGVAFLAIELAMVALMGIYIRQTADTLEVRTDYADAYTLAAIAPTPLWLSALALFVPSAWFNLAVVLAAWFGSVVLIRHGVRPLLRVDDANRAHRLANAVIVAGVAAWVALLVVLALVLGILMGWR